MPFYSHGRDECQMINSSKIATAINLRVRQLAAQGITGIALANQMIGHTQVLHDIYRTVRA